MGTTAGKPTLIISTGFHANFFTVRDIDPERFRLALEEQIRREYPHAEVTVICQRGGGVQPRTTVTVDPSAGLGPETASSIVKRIDEVLMGEVYERVRRVLHPTVGPRTPYPPRRS